MNLLLDSIIKICNAQTAFNSNVILKYSYFVKNVLYKLLNKGFIKSLYNIEINGKSYIKVILKYNRENNPTINKVHIMSKTSSKVYIKYSRIDNICNAGILFLSTSKGILSDLEAKKLRIGGEILFKIF